ncbi:MAG TPA: biosynthetic peptidoglycan transglycosylase [Acidobacteriaceae bacterium]
MTRRSDRDALVRINEFALEAAEALDLPIHFLQLFLLIEDKRFPVHPGIDIFGMMRAIRFNLIGGRYRQGASTLPQQLYEIRITTSGGTYRRTFPTKFRQVLFGVWVSRRLTKIEIVAEYLKTVYWGGAVYGLDDAAKKIFNKRRNELSVEESFYLVERLASPNRNSASRLKVMTNRVAIVGLLEQAQSSVQTLMSFYEEMKG